MQRGILRVAEGGRLLFWCPGCDEFHQVGPSWGFNGDYDKPTFTPSVLVRSGHQVPGQEGKPCWCSYEERFGEPTPFACFVCHSFVTDGRIQFLSDCTHALAGQTVDLPSPPTCTS